MARRPCTATCRAGAAPWRNRRDGRAFAGAAEALATLRRKLALLPSRHPERGALLRSTYELYGISRATLYRLLRGGRHLRSIERRDRGVPQAMPAADMEWWCEVVAAMQARTTNRKGRCLSVARCLELLVEHGIETPEHGLRKLLVGQVTASTLNRHMRRLGLDRARVTREAPTARFEARHANELWHFDMSPSDLKKLEHPPAWADAKRDGAPTLMLFSVIDDRSAVAYQEYAVVYGEDVDAALRFLFRAMSPKADNPLQGRPTMIYMDRGPVFKSAVFGRVMEALQVQFDAHMPAGSDARRTTARAKGKVERPFRTVKEAHETLYHFHQPATEAEANAGLAHFIAAYNAREHRREAHSRADDWVANLPDEGMRQMCTWERYCTFAREPERRVVASDCRITVAGVTYEVDGELVGETVIVWWGLFDQDLFVEHGDERYGLYTPVGGPVPLHRYRKHRRSRREEKADRVAELAKRISLPRAAVFGHGERWADVQWADGAQDDGGDGTDGAAGHDSAGAGRGAGHTRQRPGTPFTGPDPFHQLAFPTPLAARLAIADELRMPLGKLDDADRRFIADLVARTLVKAEVMAAVRERFASSSGGADANGSSSSPAPPDVTLVLAPVIDAPSDPADPAHAQGVAEPC